MNTIPNASEIRKLGGFDEAEYTKWLDAQCAAVTRLLEYGAKNLVQGGSVEFTVSGENRAHELWLQHHQEIVQILEDKGYSVGIVTTAADVVLLIRV